MTRYTIDGLDYHVEEKGAGEPLLLLHGFTGSAAGWRGVAPLLADRWRVIAVDLPGHGQTDAPADTERYQMGRVAADLVALLRVLHATPAHVLGYSMGGRLALYLALNFPDAFRSLVLESASPGLETEAARHARRTQDEALAQQIETEGVAAFVGRWERLPLFAGHARLPQDTQVELRARRLANRADGLAGSLRGMGTGAQPSLWDRLRQLRLPVLLLAGKEDAKFVAINHRMAEAIPAAALCIVPDAGHTIHLEQHDQWVRAVRRFLLALQDGGQGLSHSEQHGKGQGSQRHLLEPGIERG